MFIHGHYPDELLLSTILSLPKDRYGDVCDSRKYRGISLSSCITKIIDLVILLKYPHCFRTSELQFAYKKHHATPMCTLALKEVVKYYTSRRGSVYCCLLDATKAFDRVKFDKLFEIMIARNIPSCAIRLVFDMYNRQKVRTVWNGQYSSSFSTSNGVRQGGVLSPILFTLYIDVLLERLESSGVGCHIGHEYLGSLCSADDLASLAPTVFSLRRMLKICEEFSVEYDIIFNAKNTVCILFSGRHGSRTPPVMSLNGTVLHWKDTVKHLGNFISNEPKGPHRFILCDWFCIHIHRQYRSISLVSNICIIKSHFYTFTVYSLHPMFCRLHNSPLIGQRNSFMDRSGCFLPRPILIHGLLCDSNADIVLLQETWLLKRDLGVLATLHKKYLGNGKSAIPDDTILHVRPYGGLGFLWRRSLTGNIRNIHVNCYRIDAILLTHDGSVTLIVNVYLPVDNRQMQHVSPEFSECIDALEIVINEHSYHHVIIGGDFNTDFSRNNAQSKYLKHFLERNALMNVWDLPCADKIVWNSLFVYWLLFHWLWWYSCGEISHPIRHSIQSAWVRTRSDIGGTFIWRGVCWLSSTGQLWYQCFEIWMA